jgi:hypothetical protein
MSAAIITYRARQFWNALNAAPALEELELAQTILNPDQLVLFRQMQLSEQAHSLAVMKKLGSQSLQWDGLVEQHRQDLLVAALLHDAGKSLHPLKLWERILIVIGQWLFPAWIDRWGTGSPNGWRRAFVTARQHPEWGATLAAQAGSSPVTEELIRRHQNLSDTEPASILDYLLSELQAADQNY